MYVCKYTPPHQKKQHIIARFFLEQHLKWFSRVKQFPVQFAAEW